MGQNELGLIDAEAVANRYGVHRNTVFGWVERGEVPYFKIGRLVKFDPAALDAFFARAPRRDGEAES